MERKEVKITGSLDVTTYSSVDEYQCFEEPTVFILDEYQCFEESAAFILDAY